MEKLYVSRKNIKKNGFPKPVYLSKEAFYSLKKEEQNTLLKLIELLEKEEKIIKKINAKRPTEDGALFVNNGVTLCEDEDDWLVITIKERGELKKSKEKVIDFLNKSLDLGLGFLSLVQRQCPFHGIEV
jgi:hypothetical protein